MEEFGTMKEIANTHSWQFPAPCYYIHTVCTLFLLHIAKLRVFFEWNKFFAQKDIKCAKKHVFHD